MGECLSSKFDVPNEIANIQIYNEEKISTIQAAIRKHIAQIHKHTLRQSLSCTCTRAESEDIHPLHSIVTVNAYKQPDGEYSGTMCTCCNQFNGEGTYVYNDGSTYKGNWLNGKAHGHGFMKYSNGDTYNGSWKNDMTHGLGTYINKNGMEFIGQWSNDKQNGYGIEKWSDGSVYEGNFINGKKEGMGKFKWSDGSSFEGIFKDNLINGYGLYCWPDGKRFQGELKDNRISNIGKYGFQLKSRNKKDAK